MNTTQKKEPEISDPIPLYQFKNEIIKGIKQNLERNQKKYKSGILRTEFLVDETDLLSWLQHQSSTPKTYWCDRKLDIEMAGAGKADLIYSQSEVQPEGLLKIIRQSIPASYPSLHYYGGLAFDVKEEIEPCWKTLGNLYFILPRFELIRRCGQTYFAVNILARSIKEVEEQWTHLQKEIDPLDFSTTEKSSPIPVVISIQTNPKRAQWFQMIHSVLEEIKQDKFQKIVLARRVMLKFNSPVNAAAVIREQKKLNPDNVHFLIQPDQKSGFMGSTPEILYARQKEIITTEAIAGTRSRGADEQADKILEQELLNSSKDIDEHGYVVKSIQNALQKICRTSGQEGNVSVIKQARVQHLYAQFTGHLQTGMTDEDIISHLHPTPAVGGFPTGPALARLKTLEPLNRGWYAGPVGWIGSDSAKFAVAIRSSLISGNKLFLYSGAGIVKGSEAEAEWQEINNKIAGYLKILGLPEMDNR